MGTICYAGFEVLTVLTKEYTVWSEKSPMFWMKILPQSSWLVSKPSKKPARSRQQAQLSEE
jgi:hypothetical protein